MGRRVRQAHQARPASSGATAARRRSSASPRVALAQRHPRPAQPGEAPRLLLHRSNPNDVARVEQLTFICTPTKDEAGPTNNWMAPDEAYTKLGTLFDGSMKGRTMYVVPYVMGPLGSPLVEGRRRADRQRLRRAQHADHDAHGQGRARHARRRRTTSTAACTRRSTCNPERRFICHFPAGQHDLVGRLAATAATCCSARSASRSASAATSASKEGWLAEHMLILGVESPEGEMTYVAAAFPSACGKTNFAMMIPPKRFKGWKIWTVGDDIAWMRVGDDGRLWAVNPETGYFGVAPGTSIKTQPERDDRRSRRTRIFTNVALTPDGDVWWEGKDGEVPDELTDWQGRPVDEGLDREGRAPELALHRARDQQPGALEVRGRPGRRADLARSSSAAAARPRCRSSCSRSTGRTASSSARRWARRRPPPRPARSASCAATRWRCCPSAATTWATTSSTGCDMQKRVPLPPKIFLVNWFRKDKDGKFLWPGFGENMRVLKWIVDRARGRVGGQETLIGWVPRPGDLDLPDLDIAEDDVHEATKIDSTSGSSELESQGEFFETLGPTVPRALAAAARAAARAHQVTSVGASQLHGSRAPNASWARFAGATRFAAVGPSLPRPAQCDYGAPRDAAFVRRTALPMDPTRDARRVTMAEPGAPRGAGRSQALERALELQPHERAGVERALRERLPDVDHAVLLGLCDKHDAELPDPPAVRAAASQKPQRRPRRLARSARRRSARGRAAPGAALSRIARCLLVTDRCGVYCRFCTRSRMVGARRRRALGRAAGGGVRVSARASGDPRRDRLGRRSAGDVATRASQRVLSELASIESIAVRARRESHAGHACRSASPRRLCRALRTHPAVWLMTHFNHPKELTRSKRARPARCSSITAFR